jgi:hypothetical protein
MNPAKSIGPDQLTPGCPVASAASTARLPPDELPMNPTFFGPAAAPERGSHRITLRLRQELEPLKHRQAELMQRGERKLHLELGPLSAQKTEAGGVIARVLQQRRFADPRFPLEHERAATSGARSIEQAFERRQRDRSPPERGAPVRRLHDRHQATPQLPSLLRQVRLGRRELC